MKIIKTVKELEEITLSEKNAGNTIGLVPTMGALHAGHISLVNRARKENDIIVVSIFVNPTQFNNQEDLIKYPRTEKEDVAKLIEARVDYAFIPDVEEVYPQPDNRVFDLGQIAEVMEGKMRPGHFNGVAQIVSKLFKWSHPDKAYFGEKDFQQIRVIRRMNEIEGFPLEIIECEICREPDGLAMSSRNVRLNAEERLAAPQIHQILEHSKKLKDDGMKPDEIIKTVTDRIDQVPHLRTEYFEIVDSTTLLPIGEWEDIKSDGSYPVGCVTVYCGPVRLIDNIKYTN